MLSDLEIVACIDPSCPWTGLRKECVDLDGVDVCPACGSSVWSATKAPAEIVESEDPMGVTK